MNNDPVARRGLTRGQVALSFLVLSAGIACGLAIYSSATTLISLFRTASTVLFLPLLLSLVLTFLLEPIVAQLEKLFSRSGSILIVYLLMLGLLTLSALWLLPHWQSFIGNLGTDFPRYTTILTGYLRELLEGLHNRFPVIESYNLPIKFRGWAEQLLAAFLTSTPQSALRIGGLMIIVPLFTFFLLRDGRKIRRACVALAPNRHYEMVHDLSFLISKQLAEFIRGRVLEAIIIGIVVTAGLSLTDMRYAPMFGIFAGVTNLIPYIGPIIGMVPGILIAFVDFGASAQFWWIVILYVIIAQVIIDNFILIPILISRVSNLHPLWVFFAIIVGGKIYGVIGMIIGVPIVSIVKIILLEIRTYRSTFRLPETALISDRHH
ncbi:MAG: AI-2E family transporter [Deltaproteobacteria bacterium]|jgi:putative permease|nr:AI-2E family transporter [Deltaproteobacteria bacterium]